MQGQRNLYWTCRSESWEWMYQVSGKREVVRERAVLVREPPAAASEEARRRRAAYCLLWRGGGVGRGGGR